MGHTQKQWPTITIKLYYVLLHVRPTTVLPTHVGGEGGTSGAGVDAACGLQDVLGLQEMFQQ